MGCIPLGRSLLRCYLSPEAAGTHVAKCSAGSHLQNHAVPAPATRTWGLELGPDCLRRGCFNTQMPEGPKFLKCSQDLTVGGGGRRGADAVGGG